MTGRMNGAPSSVISNPRPQNRRRANALATRIASKHEKVADKNACQIVNRTAAQSAGLSTKSLVARDTTAPSADRISAAIRTAALTPNRGLIWKALRAIRPVLCRVRHPLRQLESAMLWTAEPEFQNQQANRPQASLPGTSSWLSG